MIGWNRRLAAGILALLALGVMVALGAAPTTAQQASHAQGIADSGATTFDSPLWPGLNVRHVRAIVPYDVALRDATIDQRRKDFEAWLTKAKAAGSSTNVGLGRLVGTGEGHAPNEQTYRTAFRAFVTTYGSQVDVIGPWNEPNYRPTDGSRAKLPGGRGYLDDPGGGCTAPNPTVATCGPRLAAYYYRWAAVDCPRCKLAAGEFAGTQSATYIQKYKLHLGRHRPDLWSVHNYADIIRFQVSHQHRPAELRTFLRELYCQPGNHCIRGKTDWSSGHLWIGATGAYYQLDCQTHTVKCKPGQKVHVLGEASQCQAAAFINRLSTVDPKITRIYLYTFTDGRSGDNTGIVNANGTKPRKAYSVVRDRASACQG